MRTALLALLVFLAPAHASEQDVRECLRANDVPCAKEALADLGTIGTNPNRLALAAEVHFYAGRYPEAYDTLKKAVDSGYADKWDRLSLYERTLFTTAGWTELERDGFGVRYRPGIDAVIVEGAFDVLALSEKNVAPLIGTPPPGPTLLEVHPTGTSFIAASSLTKDAVETTGTVALSKWSRLLITSPRALGRGYDWQDTVAHEYIHLVVAHATADQAPVWLQEAIAKYLDSRWRDGRDHFELTSRQQALVAEALADDSFVTFEEMHPSLAMLPTAEMASLAYAQLATLMAFAFENGGEDVLLETLPEVRDGVEPHVALARAAGFSSFKAMEREWKAYLATLDLGHEQLAELPTQLDGGGSDVDSDPVLNERDDLARYVRLGDLLRERERPLAALKEYAQARDPEEPDSPLLSARIARAHMDLDQHKEARQVLYETVADYPHFTLSLKTLGEVERELGNVEGAIKGYSGAADLNPYDREVHAALVDLYAQAGKVDKKADHERILSILRRGGEDREMVVLHEREGEFELPRSEPAEDGAHPLTGARAPRIEMVDATSGKEVRIRDYVGKKVVLLDFWATWCGPCRAAMPKLAEIQKAHKGDLMVIGVSDESQNTVRRFLAKNKIGYTTTIAPDKQAKKDFQVSGLPTLFLIDKKGRIRDVHVGAGNLGEVAAQVELLVNEQPSDGLQIIEGPEAE